MLIILGVMSLWFSLRKSAIARVSVMDETINLRIREITDKNSLEKLVNFLEDKAKVIVDEKLRGSYKSV